MEICRRLSARDPEAYESALAGCCFHIAIKLLIAQKDTMTAKALFEEALAIYKKYPQKEESAKDVQGILTKYFPEPQEEPEPEPQPEQKQEEKKKKGWFFRRRDK
jgi:hypothetical protein